MNELLQRRLEYRPIGYDISEESWLFIEDYARNYSFYYLNGNDTVTKLGCTKVFREVTLFFEKTLN